MSRARVALASVASLLVVAAYVPIASAAQLDAGASHTCAVRDGGVVCLGANDAGQLGDGSLTSSSEPVSVRLPAGRTATAVSAGGQHSCAILDDGSARCWGAGGSGQLGAGTRRGSPTSVAVQLPAGRTARAVDAGAEHTCAILDDGAAVCWGEGESGRLGNGTTDSSSVPVPVQLPAGRTATAITAGFSHSCAILDDGGAVCWGANVVGQLGNGTTSRSPVPVPVPVALPAGRTATAISVGNSHSCAILDDDRVVCWGSSSFGELGDGTTIAKSTPVAVQLPAGRSATAIANGANHSCAVLDDRTVTCWGLGSFGQLGAGSTERTSTPVPAELPSGRTATALTAGGSHTCAQLDDDSTACWGNNASGQLGIPNARPAPVPVGVLLPAGRSAESVAAGAGHSCAALADGTARCWGRNLHGELGDGTTRDSAVPVDVRLPTGRTVTALTANLGFSCAILDDGAARCWGDNQYGQLGSGTRTAASTPIAVPLGTGRTATAISAGAYHACAILDDGSAACWGYNTRGALGNGTTGETQTPGPVAVQLPAGRRATSIAAGGYHTCAVLDDGSAACWGDGDYGQLGNGGTTFSTVPVAVQLPAGRTATAITAGEYWSCAILDDGSAACWGENPYGQLGNGTTGEFFEPGATTPVSVLLPAGRTATAITAGPYHTCATLDDDTATCWGANFVGALGDGTTTSSPTPVAVRLAAGRRATTLSAGAVHTCATLDDGTAACWGGGEAGQRGDGKTNAAYVAVRSAISPTPVNTVPVCTAGAATVARDATGVEVGSCSDADPGDTLDLRITAAPTHGTAVVDGSRVRYTPDAGYTGSDSVTFVANDGAADSAAATATITVDGPRPSPGGGGGDTGTGGTGTSPSTGQAPPAPTTGPAPTTAPAPVAQPELAGLLPAKLNVRRAAVRDGRLDLLADITREATGSVRFTVTALGRTYRFSVDVPRTGILRLDRALPTTMRRARTAIIDIAYAGSGVVAPDAARLRAAAGPARLAATTSTLVGDVLTVAGTVATRARGVVRISLTYTTPAGTPYVLNYRAPIVDGRWSLQQRMPQGVTVRTGQLVVEFTGHLPTRTRGERLNRLLP
ncbi:Ig-like domain-containing protein [Paraconexibacter algicola]|uniref:RCC1-like domain-containing protein n=1 Tax=Paraconexibacter algicola TaxID=2133960 RepID=A0A2T4UJR0_9ACTN|nr:Ig-like domain-containing protein [Paraconexibacter algicola]PTL59482.1 hypothetical protein C7Y72_07395 [Paraconexibacter algicola]